MAVFNSLGSNYKFGFVLKSLLQPSGNSFDYTKKLLSDHYQGQVTLTYKGRQALELALRQSHLPADSQVGINGFTCYVVYEAVERAGHEPVFIDVAPKQLNFGVAELKAAATKYPKLRAVIVQNTLGQPADMVELNKFCREHNILVIEDLAHSLGAKYTDGQEAGMVGQMAMLSFSQDKPLDVVAGGALVNRLDKKPADISLGASTNFQRFKNRLYPLWTFKIRKTYSVGLGRYFHAALKKLHLLSTPMSGSGEGIENISRRAATLLAGKWQRRDEELVHRQAIADVYKKNLPKEIQFEELAGSSPFYLRFPIKVNDRPDLIKFLKQHRIYVGDTWYDAPIGPKKYLSMTNYTRGLCPRAEELSSTIVNLPTHINVDEALAELIARRVSAWLKY